VAVGGEGAVQAKVCLAGESVRAETFDSIFENTVVCVD